jgi:hypothetical protein
MSYVITVASTLTRPAAPRLPDATLEYDARYIDQLNNILRLYFNQLDAAFLQLQVSAIDADSAQTQIWLGNSGGFFSG